MNRHTNIEAIMMLESNLLLLVITLPNIRQELHFPAEYLCFTFCHSAMKF